MTTADRDKLRAAAEATVEAFDPAAWPDIASVALLALLDQIDQTEHRLDHWQEAYKREANRRAAAVTERDEWRQTAQDEHAAALDLIGVVKERDQRIEAVRNMADRMEASGRDQRPLEVVAALIRRALDGDTL